jgi:RNA polymerase sigma factor (sigma-70 family)
MYPDPPHITQAIKTLHDLRLMDRDSLDGSQASALEVIYRSYAGMLLGVARRVATTDIDAEDVLHDVFCRLPWALAQYRGEGLGGWLKRVTQRQALMQRRKAVRRREEQLPDNEAGSPYLAGSIPESNDDLHTALARLAKPLREVVMLRVYHDFSHQQIADALGISVTASEVRLCRAIKRLRRALQEVHPTTLRRSA